MGLARASTGLTALMNASAGDEQIDACALKRLQDQQQALRGELSPILDAHQECGTHPAIVGLVLAGLAEERFREAAHGDEALYAKLLRQAICFLQNSESSSQKR